VPDSDLFGFRARARARCPMMTRSLHFNAAILEREPRTEWIPRSLRRLRIGLRVGIKAERFDGAFFFCGIGLTIPREQSQRRLSRFRDATLRHSSATSDAPQSRAAAQRRSLARSGCFPLFRNRPGIRTGINKQLLLLCYPRAGRFAIIAGL